MTTNLAKCMNFVLKQARSFPICPLIMATFERTAAWFVERGIKKKFVMSRPPIS